MRAFATVILAGMLAGCARPSAPAPRPQANGVVSIVATAELRGTTEPCGCNSDPLGDLARLVALAKGGLLLDAGDQLYDPTTAGRAQADRKADVIGDVYSKAGAEAALGPTDLLGGVGRLKPARQACNVTLPSGIAPPRVREVGGLRIGVFGVSAHLDKAGAQMKPAVESAKAAIALLDRDHAEIVVALLAMKRADARALVAAVPGIDFAIIGVSGNPIEEGMSEPQPVNGAWLVEPADQGRRAAKIDVARGAAAAGTRLKLTRFDGEAGRARTLAQLDKRKSDLTASIAAWAKDPTADAAFVAARKQELVDVTAEREKVAVEKIAPPAAPYFSYTLFPIQQKLPRDPTVAATLQKLARDNGAANLAAAQSEPPPAPEKGKPTYVGEAQCVHCHKTAAAFWQKTQHALAWKTLVDVDKQYDYDCIGCHVTGWQEPGGANLASVEKQGLVNVQCELCHGPGSAHVAEDGLDDPKTIHRQPEDQLCQNRCHTKEHSDTFDKVPYLRDIVGVGHGEALRKSLGDGPTGHELRKKALAAAGR